MNRNLFFVALLVGLAPLSARGQVGVSDDFGDYFPGPGGPSWLFWQGGGVGGGTDPFNPDGNPDTNDFPQEISEDGLADPGLETTQAYKISFDTTNTTDWYWFGVNGGIGYFSPENLAGGVTAEQGGDDPGNWVYSLDVRAVGALGDLALLGSFTFYDPDYDTVFGVDGNGDGMVNGADTYQISFNFLDNDGDPNGFTSNSFRLDAGTATTQVPGDIPRFGNDGTWVLGFNGGGGEYQFGDNSVTIDNLLIEFSEKPKVAGDYNDDGVVDAADYTVWRDNDGQSITLPNEGDGVTPDQVTIEDYYFWRSQFGSVAGSLPASAGTNAAPEPSALALVVMTCFALSRRRSGGPARGCSL